MFSNGAALVIFDAKNPFVHASELQRSDVYVPQPVADFFEADVFAREGVGDADPLVFPANAAVAADETDLKVSGVFDGDTTKRVSPDRAPRAGGRRYTRDETG